VKIIVFRPVGQPCYRRGPAPLSGQATGGKSMNDLHDDVFAISPDIRYVAAADGQQPKMRSRPDLQNASSSNSDLYEELLVNPTPAGHIGVGFEVGANPADYLPTILSVIADHGQPAI